jgi:kinesin family member 2/24
MYIYIYRYDDMTVWVSFFEIYGGKLYDLLNDRRKLVARADAKQVVNIVGLQETEVTNSSHLMDALNAGHEARSTAATGANMDSSRSHAVLQINFKRKGAKAGKLSFIDLAGSERASDVNDNDRCIASRASYMHICVFLYHVCSLYTSTHNVHLYTHTSGKRG